MMRPGLKLLPVVTVILSLCAVAEERVVSSLGRLEPENGVVQLAGPSGGGLTGAVIKTLAVAEGDWVEKDQVVARLDSYDLRRAEVARLNAILANARSEVERQKNLDRSSLTSKVKSGSGRRGSWNSAAPIACTRSPRSMKRTLPP